MRAGTSPDVTYHRPLGPVAVVARVVEFLLTVLTLVLLVRFGLELIGASRSSGFFELMRSISEPFLAPFHGIVGDTRLFGIHADWSILVAAAAYALLQVVIRAFLRLLSRP